MKKIILILLISLATPGCVSQRAWFWGRVSEWADGADGVQDVDPAEEEPIGVFYDRSWK